MSTVTADVAVVGGGPAGLAAARELRLRGVSRVMVFDREIAAGGVPRHCNHPPFGFLEFGHVMNGPVYARKLVIAAVKAGVSILTRHTVVQIGESGHLRVASPEGLVDVEAKRVIIATGARESSRASRFLSGDRPSKGCVTTGALQSFLHQYDIVPFRHPLILGTEIVSLSAILTCRRFDIEPAAIVEELPRPKLGTPMQILSRLLGVPLYLGAKVVEVRGRRQLEAATIRLSDGTAFDIRCDGLLCTGRFVPEAGVLRASHLALDPATGGPVVDSFGRLSDHCFFVAGNVAHDARASVSCYREGRRVGAAVARDLANGLPER